MRLETWIVPAEHEHSRTNMVSDLLQAKQAILLDSRDDTLMSQMQIVGMGWKEAQAALRAAADALGNQP